MSSCGWCHKKHAGNGLEGMERETAASKTSSHGQAAALPFATADSERKGSRGMCRQRKMAQRMSSLRMLERWDMHNSLKDELFFFFRLEIKGVGRQRFCSTGCKCMKTSPSSRQMPISVLHIRLCLCCALCKSECSVGSTWGLKPFHHSAHPAVCLVEPGRNTFLEVDACFHLHKGSRCASSSPDLGGRLHMSASGPSSLCHFKQQSHVGCPELEYQPHTALHKPGKSSFA